MIDGVLVYWVCVVISIYVAYLLTFRTYDIEGYYPNRHRGKRILMPRIVYVLVLMIAFVPVLNIATSLALILAGLMQKDDYEVDSWLFRKPNIKEKEDKED